MENLYDNVKWLRNELKIAISFLKDAKKKFAPSTTNSDVDCFLKKHDRIQKKIESGPVLEFRNPDAGMHGCIQQINK